MRSGIPGAIALAIALVARTASAHELSCTQALSLDERTPSLVLLAGPALELDNYPATVTAKVTATNVHLSQASTALSAVAPFLESLGVGFSFPTPFTLGVGDSSGVEVQFQITSQQECLRLAELSGHLDGIIVSTVAVGWDLGGPITPSHARSIAQDTTAPLAHACLP